MIVLDRGHQFELRHLDGRAAQGGGRGAQQDGAVQDRAGGGCGVHGDAVTREEQLDQRRRRVAFMWAMAENQSPSMHNAIIVGARYGGTYEGARWTALLAEPEWLNDCADDDIDCMTWWADYWDAPIGRGPTPGEALEDLRDICRTGRASWTPTMRKPDYL